MSTRIRVEPRMLEWAVMRSGIGLQDVRKRFKNFDSWLTREVDPTFNQIEQFAQSTHVPLGYLFLSEPPAESLPVADFRTYGSEQPDGINPDLLETLHICERRQSWFRDYALAEGDEPVAVVGKYRAGEDHLAAADTMRRLLRFDMTDRLRYRSWEMALRQLIDNVEDIGILVMVNGVVGENTHRPLNPRVFRGFALSDPYAPLIFVNGKDTKAAQIFTLVHEAAHIFAGESGVSDASIRDGSSHASESWANRVAAEVLVPSVHLQSSVNDRYDVEELERLARAYKVSTLVILLRLLDIGVVPADEFDSVFDTEYARVKALAEREGSGGQYYYSQPLKISRTFARAVIADALEGRTLYRDAYALLGSSKHKTFAGMARELGVG